MAEKKEEAPTPAIKHSDDGLFVHYGFEQDGVFHPFASERVGDHNERIKAAKEAEE